VSLDAWLGPLVHSASQPGVAGLLVASQRDAVGASAPSRITMAAIHVLQCALSCLPCMAKV
jgi:hypothetical protein